MQSILANKEAHVEKIKFLFSEIDAEDRGVITYKMFEEKVGDQAVKAYFESMDLDVWDAWSFFKLLDLDAGGAVEIEEFLMGCLRLRGSARAIDIAKLIHDQAWLLKNQSHFWTFVEVQLAELRQQLKQMAPENIYQPAFGDSAIYFLIRRLWRITSLVDVSRRWTVASVNFYWDLACSLRIQDGNYLATGWALGFEVEHAFLQNNTLSLEWAWVAPGRVCHWIAAKASSCDGCGAREAWLAWSAFVPSWPRCVQIYQSTRLASGSTHLAVERYDGNQWVTVAEREARHFCGNKIMSPLLGGHLHLARDSLIGEDEEVTPLLQLSRGLDLGDFVSTAPLPPQCLRRSVGMTSFIFAPGTKSRSPSPGLRACSSRAAVSPSSPLLSSRIRRSGTIATNGPNRPNQSPHFWQPWSAREVKSPHPMAVAPNQSPREAKHSGRSAIRGRSPRSPTAGHSPKSSPSPETSRSPSLGAAAAGTRNAPPGARMALPQRRSRGGVGSPRAASPFNPHTDYDIHLDLPVGKWHRFETRVGIADESKWPSATRAKFQVIEDDKTLLWESTESLELWAPMELCSVLMAEKSCEKGPGGLKHLCLRVRCSAPPEGAVWIDPVLTMRPEKREKRSSRSSQVSQVDRSDRSNRLVDRSFQEMFASELLMELVCRLSCCDVARLLTACRHGLQSQQAAWHCAFAHSFKQAYLRYFLGPLRKPTGPNGTAIQWLGGSQNGSFTFAPYGQQRQRANGSLLSILSHGTRNVAVAALGHGTLRLATDLSKILPFTASICQCEFSVVQL
eukprot:symbB.v1.2.032326.t1/scaffold3869.1/size49035/1